MSNSDFLDDLVDAVVDGAAGTLGFMAPEFLPAILAASHEVKEPLRHAANDALQAAADWSRKVGGPQRHHLA